MNTDTGKEKVLKYFFSFITFIFITVLSLLICAESVFIHPYFLQKSFTTYEYTMELYNNIDDYAKSVSKNAGIGIDAAEKAVTFEAVKKINDAYICEKLKTENQYNDQTYDYFMGVLESNLKELLVQQLNHDSVKLTGTVNDAADAYVKDVVRYIDTAVRLSYTEDLYALIPVADTALKAASVIAGVLVGAFAVIVFYIGKKRYRGLRFVSYAVCAASITDMLLAVAAYVYTQNYGFALYPKYLQYALENHINSSILALICASVFLFAVYTALLAACWKLKRKNK